jgi:hypothetical protein
MKTLCLPHRGLNSLGDDSVSLALGDASPPRIKIPNYLVGPFISHAANAGLPCKSFSIQRFGCCEEERAASRTTRSRGAASDIDAGRLFKKLQGGVGGCIISLCPRVAQSSSSFSILLRLVCRNDCKLLDESSFRIHLSPLHRTKTFSTAVVEI